MSAVCYNAQCVLVTCVPFTINPGKSGLIILIAKYTYMASFSVDDRKKSKLRNFLARFVKVNFIKKHGGRGDDII